MSRRPPAEPVAARPDPATPSMLRLPRSALLRSHRAIAWPSLRNRLPQPPAAGRRLRGMASAAAMPGGTRVINGVEYRRLEQSYDSEALFAFNKEHGSTPLNFIPDDAVRAHLGRIATGETIVWAAFCEGELAGFISGERGGGYWTQTGAGEEPCCFINEFVVAPKWRGKRIGVNLTTVSVDPEMGIWAQDPSTKEMYTTVHVDNIASRTAFIKGGYRECITYRDDKRDRNTTVLKMSSVSLPACSATSPPELHSGGPADS